MTKNYLTFVFLATSVFGLDSSINFGIGQNGEGVSSEQKEDISLYHGVTPGKGALSSPWNSNDVDDNIVLYNGEIFSNKTIEIEGNNNEK